VNIEVTQIITSKRHVKLDVNSMLLQLRIDKGRTCSINAETLCGHAVWNEYIQVGY